MEQSNVPQAQGVDNFIDWQKKAAIFLSSQSASLLGSMLVQYAIIWHLTLETQSGAVLTIATIAGFLPQILLLPFAGVWADRYPRKLLIISADLLTAVSTLVLAIFFLMGYRELWLIYLLSAVRSVGGGIQAPAVGALLPQIVPMDRLMKVNSINGTLQPFIMIIAPVVAGAMLSVSTLESIFFVDVVTAAIAVGLLLMLRVPPHQKAAEAQQTGYLDDLKEGLRYIGQHALIKRLFFFFAISFFLIAPVAFLSPLLVARSFGEEVWRLTANEITFFGGSILGGVIMTAWGGFKNRVRTIGFAFILWGVLFAGLGIARDFIFYLVLMTLSGLPMPFMNASIVTLLQETVDPNVQGRVFSVQGLIMSTVMPLGMLFFGPLADVVSIELLLVVSGVPMALAGLWLFMKGLPITPLPEAAQPEFEMQPGD